MNKILRLVCRQADFKKIVSIGFFAAFLAVFLSAGTAQAGFWDWFRADNENRTDNNSQQAAVSSRAKTYTLRVSKSGYGGNYRKVTSDDKKINCGSDCSERYAEAKTITLTAVSGSSNYYFDKWTGSCSGSGSCVVEVNKPNGTVSVTAVFKKGISTKPISAKDAVDTTESSSSNSEDETSSSSSATLTAKTGDAHTITSNSATIYGTINPQGENVSVYFKYRKNSESSGATKTTSWTSTGSKSNDVITSIKISDLSSGTKYVYRFYAYNYTTGKTIYGELKYFTTSKDSSNSSSSSSSSNSSSVSSGASSSSSSSVQQYTLKVKIAGAGKITSSGGSGVVNCKKSIDSKGKGETSGDCIVKFNKGESVTLTPSTPSSQYEFATWAEACRGSQRLSSCTVIMSGNKTVSATFNKKSGSSEKTATVSVRKTGKGSGKVISINYKGSAMAGINCGNDCSENFKQLCETSAEGIRDKTCGTVYFKAVAEKGSTFSGWGGDCLTFKNVKDQCYVILDGAKTITANFNEGSGNTTGKYFDLTVAVSEGGTVATTDNKISCDSSSSPCKHSYGKNGTVTLKATPNSGYSVGDYSGCSKSGNVQNGVLACKVKMTQNRNVKINFKASGTTSSSSSSSSSKSSSSASANHTASNGSATSVKSTSATLNGTVNPKGENVSYTFTYGKNGVSGVAKNTSWKSAGSGSSDVSVSANISGLSSGTEYYYWITAYSYTTKTYAYGAYATSTREYFTTSGGSSSSSSSSSSENITLKITLSGTGSVYRDGYGNLGCGTDQAPATNNVCTQTITKDSAEHSLTGYSGSLKSWSGCDSVESSTCKFKADGNKNITATFN